MAAYLVDRRSGTPLSDGDVLLNGFFTTNPSVYRRSILDAADAALTPDGRDIEHAMSSVMSDLKLTTRALSGKNRIPRLLHIGAVSTGRLRASKKGVSAHVWVYISVHFRRQWIVSKRWLRDLRRLRLR